MHDISGTHESAGEKPPGVELCMHALGFGTKPIEDRERGPQSHDSGTFDNVRTPGLSDSKTFSLSPVIFPIPITPHWPYRQRERRL